MIEHQDRSVGRSAARRVGMAAAFVLALTAGLLLWGRLRLVTGMPRQALADPKAADRAVEKPRAAEHPQAREE